MSERIMSLCKECETLVHEICSTGADLNQLDQVIQALNKGQNTLGRLDGWS